ncbi:ribonuclease H protein [Rhizobium phage RHph_Y1_1]|nr:ribonuclease H protein [Rhizobium phage RHph_I36]QIG75374.1 ribonuclease H protein [Rhizobium phage RHph_Y1_1]QIG75924.1 ribonuclease H protein [Rhizobium phage RHph_Y2_17_2]
MKMTLFADASLCSETGAAGWGSWAIRDGWGRGRFQGGQIKLKDCKKITSSNTAETAGIALALWQHYVQGDLKDLEAIMIQCDNLTALGYIKTRLPWAVVSKAKGIKHGGNIVPVGDASPVVRRMVDTIAETVQGIQVTLRHVKGHNDPSMDGRSWVNNQCDAEAKRHMKALRKELAASAEQFDRYKANERNANV